MPEPELTDDELKRARELLSRAKRARFPNEHHAVGRDAVSLLSAIMVKHEVAVETGGHSPPVYYSPPSHVEARLHELSQLPVIPVTATRLDDEQLIAACAKLERLPFWTLTFNAADQPGKWCARLGFSFDPTEITQNAVLGATREECAEKIPLMAEGRWTFTARHIDDQPQIIGVWI